MKQFPAAIAVVGCIVLGGWALRSEVSHAAPNTPSEWIPVVRAEARKWQPDAALVAVEFSSFGFATDPATQMPDMTRSGPPNIVMFSFFSPSARDGVRVTVNNQQLSPQLRQFVERQGLSPVQIQHFMSPWSPYTLPIPDGTDLDFTRAIDAARKDIADQCPGDARWSNCQLVTSVELHMFWRGQGDATGRPVWTVKFGQDPRTFHIVERQVDGTSLQVLALDPRQPAEQQGALFQGQPAHLHNVSVTTAEPGFAGIWRGVNAAVRQQDPLYKPYAVSLAVNLRSQAPGEFLRIGEMYVQYARITPSLVWDDMTVHLEGRGRTLNVIFADPVRKSAPLQPAPITLEADRLPDPDATLRQLVSIFPKGYYEIYYTDYQGCQSRTIGNLTEQTCGVWMQQEHRTDLVFFWLTRQGNPFWNADDNPIASEHAMIADRAPRGEWVWWTRIKHANVWQYYVIDAESGRTLPDLCTNPNDGGNTIQSYPC